MTQLPEDSSHKCVICGQEINKYSLYCSKPQCRHLFSRKMAIIHNSQAYKIYIWLYQASEEEALFRGDIE